jgi:predicted transposase/invertase (TIGR01784 family)
MTKLKYTFKTDLLFKYLFVKYPNLLKRLVARLLRIKLAGIEQWVIMNPEIPPETLGKKFCRLDVRMTVNGQLINLEVQVKDEGDYPERALFYWAKSYSNALPAGGEYAQLPRTIVISILNFNLFSCAEFSSEFQLLEVSRHELLTDKIGFIFYELLKTPEEMDKDDYELLWLALFRANTKEELQKIEALGVPEMNEAIGAYRTVTASREFLELERLREKAAHDEAQALGNAERRGRMEGRKEGRAKGRMEGRKEGRKEVVQNAMRLGVDIDTISALTGLTHAEIKALHGTD